MSGLQQRLCQASKAGNSLEIARDLSGLGGPRNGSPPVSGFAVIALNLAEERFGGLDDLLLLLCARDGCR